MTLPQTPSTGDISAEDFRTAAHAAVDWIADYLEHPEGVAVRSRVAPGDITRALPDRAPAEGESLEAIMRDFHGILMPGITHWNHPSFFAYFAISGVGSSRVDLQACKLEYSIVSPK